MSTKKRIIEAALTLFSQKGFHPVTVDEIAKAVGIKAPSLYKHFTSKQGIFDAILEEMQSRYRRQMEELQMNGQDAAADRPLFESISEQALLQVGRNLFSFFLHDAYNQKFRKMLVLEQFSNEATSSLYIQQYFDAPLCFQEALFSSLHSKAPAAELDPKILALHFYAPIYFLLALCDAQPEREAEALALVEKHIQQFNRIYKMGENPDE